MQLLNDPVLLSRVQFALPGGIFLVIKTRGGLQATSRKRSSQAAWIMLAAAAYVTVATPLSCGYITHRWFVMPQVFFLAMLPLAGLAVFARLIQTLKRGDEHAPFAWSTVIFMVSFVGLATSLYPYPVPPEFSHAAAASSGTTLVFMLVGIGMLLPVMLVYNDFQYLVFRGKILHERPDSGSLQGNTGRDSVDPVIPGPAGTGGY